MKSEWFKMITWLEFAACRRSQNKRQTEREKQQNTPHIRPQKKRHKQYSNETANDRDGMLRIETALDERLRRERKIAGKNGGLVH